MKDLSASRSTREELLKWAQEYLQSRGASGFSFQDLADQLKIKKASIHYHFRTKNDLFRELIQDYRESFRTWAEKHKEAKANVKWNGYISMFRQFARDRRWVCPAGAMSLEIASFPASIRRLLCDFQIEQRQWLEEMILQGQDEGLFSEQIHPRSAAILVGSAIQGSLQIAKLHDSPVVFEKAMSELEKVLKGSLK